jgi:hypothetical protein
LADPGQASQTDVGPERKTAKRRTTERDQGQKKSREDKRKNQDINGEMFHNIKQTYQNKKKHGCKRTVERPGQNERSVPGVASQEVDKKKRKQEQASIANQKESIKVLVCCPGTRHWFRTARR